MTGMKIPCFGPEQGGIDFSRNPLRTAFLARSQFFGILLVCFAGIFPIGIDGIPVGFTAYSGFVAHPAGSGTNITENYGIGLVFINQRKNGVITIIGFTIDVSPFIGSAVIPCSPVCTIDPELKNIAIIGHELFQLIVVIRNVSFATVLRMIPVPWRQVNAQS